VSGVVTLTKEEREAHSSKVLTKHISNRPESVIILSMKDGQMVMDVTSFPNLETLALSQKLVNMQIENSFKETLFNSQPVKN
jgi:hypothetical protein